MLGKIAEGKEHCGLPVPIAGERLILEPRHPVAHVINSHLPKDEEMPDGCHLVNVFYSHHDRCDIVIWREADGRLEWGRLPMLNNIKHQFSTMACSVAWSVEAEAKAMKTLSTMIPRHLFDMYFLSGMFMETSKRSGVTYLFRKLRPTIAMRPHPKKDDMKILAALCLHPIGYYAESWAGAMVPTDDVMAHLLLMRGDEKMFWRRANQIAPHRPNAGL